MIKFLKQLSLKNWLSILVIIALTIVQVYYTMQIVDYVGIITALVQMSDLDGVMNNGVSMIIASVILVLAQVLISVLASWIASDIVTNVRGRIYSKVSSFSLSDLSDFSTESLITRTTNDLQNVHLSLLMALRTIFAVPIIMGWSIVKLLDADRTLMLTSAVWLVILVVATVILLLLLVPKFKVMQKYTDGLNGSIRENLTGVRVIRAFNAEEYQENKFAGVNESFTKTQIFAGRVIAVFSPFIMFVFFGLTLSLLWISSYIISGCDAEMAFGMFSSLNAFVMLISQVVLAFILIISLIVVWPRSVVCARRIMQVISHENSIKDPENPENFAEKGTIEFKDVSFKYPGGDGNALSNISFKVNQGESIAFIGATGSGKSTVINLIPRLFDVTEGKVLVDGVDVRKVKQEDLRNIIGYAPQRGYLFKGDIKGNIAFSDPSMPMERIVEAAKVAQAHDFISEKEEGYNSAVAQGGTNFSGGQKQRICIARTVAKRPEILIFDDSFSALDYKTDEIVRSNIKKYDSKATRVIIAQRIGTIMDADQIVVLERGEIVGIGKHKDLIKSCEVYKEIALSQLSEEELGL